MSTEGERLAYLRGIEVGIAAVDDGLKRGLSGDDAVQRARTSAASVRLVVSPDA